MTLLVQDLGLTRNIDVLDQTVKVDELFMVDAGCGDMSLSRALAKRGARVLGIDPDPVQSEKNLKAETIANVGFAQTGAQAIPVDDHSVDGVIFSYSLHHVPQPMYPAVFKELRRVLKHDGFIYVIEPVAAGDLNEVMRLFHDEAEVRMYAQEALDTLAKPHFRKTTEINYRVPTKYDSWEDFETQYINASYNTSSYTRDDVSNGTVKKRFLEVAQARNYEFECPVKVTYLEGPKIQQT